MRLDPAARAAAAAVPDERTCGHRFVLSTCDECRSLTEDRINARLEATRSGPRCYGEGVNLEPPA